MAKSSIKLSDVVNFASTQVDLMPLSGVGGFANEPALSLCNDTLEELLATEAFPWKCNRVELTAGSGAIGTPYGSFLVTQQNKQDYLFAGAVAFSLNGGGVGIATATNNGITEVSTTATVTTLEAHPFNVGDTVYLFGCTVAGYNSSLTQTSSSWTYANGYTVQSVPSSTTFTITATGGLGTSGAPGITDFGWLEGADMVEMNNTGPLKNLKQLSARRHLSRSASVNNPTKVSVLQDNYDGTVTIRLSPVPGGTIWGVAPVYQAKAPLKTSLTQFFDPFPDELSFVYRQMFLARAYRHYNSPKADVEEKKAQAAIMKGLGLKDAEDSDEGFAPERSLLEF